MKRWREKDEEVEEGQKKEKNDKYEKYEDKETNIEIWSGFIFAMEQWVRRYVLRKADISFENAFICNNL